MEGQRVSKKPASSVYVDVFGGPPRFAASPFPSRPDDYAEIFGGSGTSCSIPFLDLPPETYGLDGDTAVVRDGPGFDYSEVFGDLDFREFSVAHEDLFSSSRGVEVGSANGRDFEDPIINGQPIKESEYPLEDANCIEDDLDCFPLNCDLSNHNSGKSNLANNVKNNGSNDGAVRRQSHKSDPPRSILECTTHLQMQKPGAPISKVNNVDLRTSGNVTISDIKECSSLCSASELNHINLDLHSRSSSSNSVTNDDVTSSDAMYVSVVDVSLQTQPLQVPPPLRPPPKACNKINHPFLKTEPNVEISIDGHHSSQRNEYPECYGFVSKIHAPQVVMRDGPSLDVDIDASSAAAAIKKAMELAEARLKSARELMERKRVNYLNRKKSHHETISEQKLAQYSFFLDNTSVITTQKKLAKEGKIDDIPSEKGNITNVLKADLDVGDTTRDVIMSKHGQEMMKENSLAPEKECLEWKMMDREQSRIASKEQSLILEHVHVQEPIRKMMKGTTSINKDSHYDNKEVTLPSEFKSNNNLNADIEKIDEPKIATDVKDDYDSCKGEPIEDLDNVVLMEPQLQEDIDILKDTHISCSVENKKLEEAQEVHGENLSIPFSFDKSPVAVRNEENLETFDIHKFEESKDAKRNYEFEDNLHDFQSVQMILSDTLELETAKVTSESGKVEKKFTADNSNSEECDDGTILDASMIGVVPHDKEMRMAFVSGMFDAEKELDALCEYDDSINPSREVQVEDGHSNNLVQMDRRTMKTMKEVREEPYSKQESSISEKYDSGVVVDQGTDEIGYNSMIQNATGVISYEPKNAKEDGASSQDRNEFKSNGPPVEAQKRDGAPEAVLKSCLLEKSEMQTAQHGGKKVRENEKIGDIHANPDVSEEQVEGGHSDNPVQMDENTVETLKEDRVQQHLNKESSISGEYESGLVVDHETDKIGENSMKQKGIGVMAYEEPENAKADGRCSEDCNEFKANELPGENQKCDETPEAVQESCLLEKSEQTIQQGEKEVRENEKLGEIHANPDNIDIVNRDSDARCCLLFKDSDVQSENGDGISELQSPQGASDIYNVGPSKITSNFKKTEDKESEVMEKESKSSGICTRKLEEEEREREKEREKDRAAVERAIHEVHERAHAKAQERAERNAVERVTSEVRQRALKEAQEKVDKANALAAEKSVAEQVLKEARLKAERSAVERAIAEARGRAAERALAEKAAGNGRERKERPNGFYRDKMSKENGTEEHSKPWNKDGSTGAQFHNTDSLSNSKGYSFVDSQKAAEDESSLRNKARLERHQRTAERVANALAEKSLRDVLAQREQAERNRLAEYLDPDIKRWSNGKEGNLRALLSTLQYILGPESGWQPISLTGVIAATAVKKAYRKATLYVHPDKLQQRGASLRQKYICEKVFDLLKDAWNKFNSEER
ncbi:uncharacterized protein LOC122033621 [Zingiber officinale]|uniref:uncharacterized protein LOC122033621 n=1 Tax=Zingiber officinale TaxID=94328 RepID=UPI001C4A7727|nr:uncharacterized protein LOC122033621 [Zingiber officinale]